MDFRTYSGAIDWSLVGFMAVMTILVCLGGIMLYTAITVSNQRMDEHKSFKAKCIDAGGAPVSPFDYVKGHGEGYLCINPSAIIEVN